MNLIKRLTILLLIISPLYGVAQDLGNVFDSDIRSIKRAIQNYDSYMDSIGDYMYDRVHFVKINRCKGFRTITVTFLFRRSEIERHLLHCSHSFVFQEKEVLLFGKYKDSTLSEDLFELTSDVSRMEKIISEVWDDRSKVSFIRKIERRPCLVFEPKESFSIYYEKGQMLPKCLSPLKLKSSKELRNERRRFMRDYRKRLTESD